MRTLDMGGSGGEQQLSGAQIDRGFDSVMGGIRRCLVLIPGDEAIVLGAQVPAAELAALCGTIPYEILTGIAARAPRLYAS